MTQSVVDCCLNLKLTFLISLALIALIVQTAWAQPPTLLWSDEDANTVEIAVSKDGQYIAAAAKVWVGYTVGQLRFYSRTSATPLWTWTALDEEEKLFSVALSADGDYVVAGGEAHVFFWKNARSLRGIQEPTWTGLDVVVLSEERRCLDISDDGNYVVFCGPREDYGIIYYWADARTKTETMVPASWSWSTDDVEAVDLSSDGNYLTAGLGTDVAYWKNARTLTGSAQSPSWMSTEPNGGVADVAVSDDGDYAAAAADAVYYWAGAKNLVDDPPATWHGGMGLDSTSIDTSCDANSVIAGTAQAALHFWAGARLLTGTPPADWTRTTAGRIEDVEINDAGTYVAAVDSVPADGEGFLFTAYFYDKDGLLKWTYPFPFARMTVSLSTSCDGGRLAIGIGVSFTAYLFDTGFSTPCCGAAPPSGVGIAVMLIGVGAGTAVAVVGFAIVLSRAKPMNYCRYCGRPVPPNARHCQWCRRALVW